MTYRIFVSSLAILVAGCASNSIPDPDPEAGTGTADAGVTAGAYDSGDYGQGESISDESSPLATVVYFDYDRAELGPRYKDLLAQHAHRLSDSSSITVRLEGHADERGTREYNIGLGERRSQAVRMVLIANGVPASQLSTISFGEERPAAMGSDEQSYAQNRRVEIKYTY